MQSDLGADSTDGHGNIFFEGRPTDKPGQDQGNGVHAGVHLGSAGS